LAYWEVKDTRREAVEDRILKVEQTLLTASSGSSLGLVIILLVVGLVALGAELFILPGFGVAGIIGVLAMLGGAAAAWVQYGPFWGGITVVGTVVLTTIMTIVTLKSRAVRKRLVLDTQLERGGGTQSQDLGILVGKTGTAKTDLRPAGIAEVDGTRVDVVSQGRYIEKGSSIKVVEIDGPRVIVIQTD
jgi:membrane-bound serine protease (ClpP class)